MENEYKIIDSENDVVDVEYICTKNHSHKSSLTLCENNCNRYSFCQRVAEANDVLVEEGY